MKKAATGGLSSKHRGRQPGGCRKYYFAPGIVPSTPFT